MSPSFEEKQPQVVTNTESYGKLANTGGAACSQFCWRRFIGHIYTMYSEIWPSLFWGAVGSHCAALWDQTLTFTRHWLDNKPIIYIFWTWGEDSNSTQRGRELNQGSSCCEIQYDAMLNWTELDVSPLNWNRTTFTHQRKSKKWIFSTPDWVWQDFNTTTHYFQRGGDWCQELHQ